MKRRPNLFNAFRRDRLAGLWLAALLLFVPYLQPLSEALAAGKPFAGEICSTFGTSGKAAMPGLADDCAACISGSHAPQLGAVPADGVLLLLRLPELDSVDLSLDRYALASPQKRWFAPPGQGPPSIN
jgi:hypothetical protein